MCAVAVMRAPGSRCGRARDSGRAAPCRGHRARRMRARRRGGERTSEPGSAMLPKTMARVAQACWHAVWSSGRWREVPRSETRVYVLLADALHAERALLHHTALADGDVRVVDQLLDGVLAAMEVEPVEAPHLVRAVVRAEPRADAAVVDHLVQTILAVDGRVDGADVLARRLLAVLAEHRLRGDRRGSSRR